MNKANSSRLCKDCKSELKPEARKCAECGSHQGLVRRWTSPFVICAGFAVTVFTLLNFPQIKDATEAKRAVINVSIVKGDFGEILFMVANTGNRPAAIESAEIRSTTKAGNPIWFYLQSPLKDSLLKPGEAVLAKATDSGGIPADMTYQFQLSHMENRIPRNCVLEIGLVQIDGRHEQVDLPFHCSPIDPLDHTQLRPDAKSPKP